MNRNDKLLTIIEKLIDITKEGHTVEYILGLPGEDYGCGDPGDKGPTEEELEEGREEVTEHVKDNSPKSLKEENEHLSNLLDSMCELYGASRVVDNGVETILYDPEVVKEVHKVLKKKRN